MVIEMGLSFGSNYWNIFANLTY